MTLARAFFDDRECTGFRWTLLGIESRFVELPVPRGFLWRSVPANEPWAPRGYQHDCVDSSGRGTDRWEEHGLHLSGLDESVLVSGERDLGQHVDA